MIREVAWNRQALLQCQSKAGDAEVAWTEDGFRAFFLEHYGRVATMLNGLLGDRSRAEEVASEAFWRLYRQAAKPRAGGNMGGWIYRTAVNLGIDALRSEARRKRYEQAAARAPAAFTAHPDPLNDVLRQERRARVRKALAALRPAHSQLLILRASGFSYRELSEILKMKPGSVGTMLIRAEAKFRKRYLDLHGREEVL